MGESEGCTVRFELCARLRASVCECDCVCDHAPVCMMRNISTLPLVFVLVHLPCILFAFRISILSHSPPLISRNLFSRQTGAQVAAAQRVLTALILCPDRWQLPASVAAKHSEARACDGSHPNHASNTSEYLESSCNFTRKLQSKNL